MDQLFEMGTVVDVGALEQIRLEGKAKPRQVAIALAHGLAVDRHVDGRLRLTSAGLAALRSPT